VSQCNESGLTDPQSTVGWGIVDFEYDDAAVVVVMLLLLLLLVLLLQLVLVVVVLVVLLVVLLRLVLLLIYAQLVQRQEDLGRGEADELRGDAVRGAEQVLLLLLL